MSGKGSKRRPQQISDDELARRWAMAFGKRRKACDDPPHESVVNNPQLASDGELVRRWASNSPATTN